MLMSVEYGFVLLLVLGKDSLYQFLVLVRCRRFAIAGKILPEVDEDPGGFCRNLCDASSYLVKTSVNFNVYYYK